MKTAIIALWLTGSALTSPAFAQLHYQKIANGIAVTPQSGSMAKVEVSVWGDGIIHVVGTPRVAAGNTTPVTPSLMAPSPPAAGAFTIAEKGGHVRIKAAKSTADVDLATGLVCFSDAKGHEVLAESSAPTFKDTTVDGEAYVSVSQQFNRNSQEGFYGLGQQQNAEMDYNGEDVELMQHNMVVAIPFLVSTSGYGLLWDNNGISRFGNPAPYKKVGEGLAVTSNGAPGFTAEYYLDDKPVLTRQEATINYQYIKDQSAWPEAAKVRTVAVAGAKNTEGSATQQAQQQKVVWSGQILPTITGVHKFRLYASGYYKVWVDGKLVLDRWRPNFNPWYTNFEVPLTAGKPADIRIEWISNKDYIALYESDPLPDADRHSLWMTSDVARTKNYWFVPGGSIDGAIAEYRQLTGAAEMMPKWAYGFWQSRQRYTDAKELTGVLDTYRRLKIPLDNIVLDWRYWRDDAWGSHVFDATRFPDPTAMVDAVHAQHAHIMISVWAKFYPSTDNYKELAAKGAVYKGNLDMGYKDWVAPGYVSTFYDPYSAAGRDIYWRQIRDTIASHGFDAWWADADEPNVVSNVSIPEWTQAMGPNAMGPAAEFFNSYALLHTRSFYDGWRNYKPDVRPFILSRSGFAGIQRNGAAIWSGDTASRWWDLKAQVAAGVNASMSGLPNWTHDIGGYSAEARFVKPDPKPEDLEEWRELQMRWFEFGAFSPLFRSHGEGIPREIYLLNPEGSPQRAAMIWYDDLRYRLMPYIYTQGADTYMKGGSIMRALATDFPNDITARKLSDQYLFGDAFLVAPVVDYKARTRQVYFPDAGTWYDFSTARAYRGGQTATVDAPLERMPLFVRAGAIIPMGPVTQYVDEQPDAPVTITVYTGADGAFSLYEDDGTTEQYKRGAFSRIPLSYNEKAGVLTIGARTGKGWKGMPASRTIRVKWVSAGKPVTDDNAYDAEVTYTGAAIAVKRK